MGGSTMAGRKKCHYCKRTKMLDETGACPSCRRRLDAGEKLENQRVECPRCGRPFWKNDSNYCPICSRLKDPTRPYVSQKGSGGRAVCYPRVSADRDRYGPPTRECHDCGKPTSNFRCEDCWRKACQKARISRNENIAEGWE